MASWMTQFQGSDALEGNRIDSKVTETTDDKVIIALKSGKKERKRVKARLETSLVPFSTEWIFFFKFIL